VALRAGRLHLHQVEREHPQAPVEAGREEEARAAVEARVVAVAAGHTSRRKFHLDLLARRLRRGAFFFCGD
jgi:hypothetical protein